MIAVLLGVGLGMPSIARADDGLPLVIPLAPPGDDRWTSISFRRIERATSYEVRSDPSGRPAFRAKSDCGASALVLELPDDFDSTRTPRLAWRWRIERGLDNEHERTNATDDFAARVYVLFRFDRDRASAWRRFQARLGRRLFGREIPGQTLVYVWSSRAARGESWTSPRHDDARLLVLESDSDAGSSREWREEVVDLLADARRQFADPPRRPPYALGLMTDSDDLCAAATAWFSDFRLLGPRPAGPAQDVLPGS